MDEKAICFRRLFRRDTTSQFPTAEKSGHGVLTKEKAPNDSTRPGYKGAFRADYGQQETIRIARIVSGLPTNRTGSPLLVIGPESPFICGSPFARSGDSHAVRLVTQRGIGNIC